MSGPRASRKRKGTRHACSYCGKVHKKGKKRGNSCGGRNVRLMEQKV